MGGLRRKTAERRRGDPRERAAGGIRTLVRHHRQHSTHRLRTQVTQSGVPLNEIELCRGTGLRDEPEGQRSITMAQSWDSLCGRLKDALSILILSSVGSATISLVLMHLLQSDAKMKESGQYMAHQMEWKDCCST